MSSTTDKMPFMTAEKERSSLKEDFPIKPLLTLHQEESLNDTKDMFSEDEVTAKSESKTRIIATVDRRPDKNYVMTLNLDELDIFNRTTKQNEFIFNLDPSPSNIDSALQNTAFSGKEKKDFTIEKISRPKCMVKTEQTLPKSTAFHVEQRKPCEDVGDSSKDVPASMMRDRSSTELLSPSKVAHEILAPHEGMIYPHSSELMGGDISPMYQAASPKEVLVVEEPEDPSKIPERYSTGNELFADTSSKQAIPSRNIEYREKDINIPQEKIIVSKLVDDTHDIGHTLPKKASEYRHECKSEEQIHHPSKTHLDDCPVNIEVPTKDHLESRQTFGSAEMKHLQRPIFSILKEIANTYPKNIDILAEQAKSTKETMSLIQPHILGVLDANMSPESKVKQQETYSLKEKRVEFLETNINQTEPTEKEQFTPTILPPLGDREISENITDQNEQFNLPRQHSHIQPNAKAISFSVKNPSTIVPEGHCMSIDDKQKHRLDEQESERLNLEQPTLNLSVCQQKFEKSSEYSALKDSKISQINQRSGQILPKDLVELHSEQTEVQSLRTPQPSGKILAKSQGQDLEKKKITRKESIKPENLSGNIIEREPDGSSSKANLSEHVDDHLKKSSFSRKEGDKSVNLIPPAAFPKTDQFVPVIYEKAVVRNQDTIEIMPKNDNHLREESQVKKTRVEQQANIGITSRGHEESTETDSHLIKDTERPKLSGSKESDIFQTDRIPFKAKATQSFKEPMSPTMTQGPMIGGNSLSKSIEILNESYSLLDKSPQILETRTNKLTEEGNLPTILSRSGETGSSNETSDQISNRPSKQPNMEKTDTESQASKTLKQKEESQEMAEMLKQVLNKTMKKTVEGLSRDNAMDSHKVKNLSGDKKQIQSGNNNLYLGSTTEDNLPKHADQLGPEVYQEAVCRTQDTDKTLPEKDEMRKMREQFRGGNIHNPEMPGKREEFHISKGSSQKGYEESISPKNLEIRVAERSVSKGSDVPEDKSISFVAKQTHLSKEPVSPAKSEAPGSGDFPLEQMELKEKGLTAPDASNSAIHAVCSKMYQFGPDVQSKDTSQRTESTDVKDISPENPEIISKVKKSLEKERVAKQKLGDTVKEKKKGQPYKEVEPAVIEPEDIPKTTVNQLSKYWPQESTLSSQELIPSEMDSLKKKYTLPAGETTKMELEHMRSSPKMATTLEDTSPTKVSAAHEKNKKKMKTSQHKEGASEKEISQKQTKKPSATYLIGTRMLSSCAVFSQTLLK